MCQINNTQIKERKDFFAYKVVKRILVDEDYYYGFSKTMFRAPFRRGYIYRVGYYQESGGDCYSENIIKNNEAGKKEDPNFEPKSDPLDIGYLHFFPTIDVCKRFINEHNLNSDYTIIKVKVILEKCSGLKAYNGEFFYEYNTQYPSIACNACEVIEEVEGWDK